MNLSFYLPVSFSGSFTAFNEHEALIYVTAPGYLAL